MTVHQHSTERLQKNKFASYLDRPYTIVNVIESTCVIPFHTNVSRHPRQAFRLMMLMDTTPDDAELTQQAGIDTTVVSQLYRV